MIIKSLPLFTWIIVIISVVLSGCTWVSPAPLETLIPGTATYPISIPTATSSPSAASTLAFTATSTPLSLKPFPTAILTTAILTPTLTILPLMEGHLINQINRLEENAPRPGSEKFVQSNKGDLDNFRQLAEDLVSGDLQTAAALATKYNYELFSYIDNRTQAIGAGNNSFIVLREQTPFKRAWGLYIFRPQGCNPDYNIIVEAPHTLADENTPRVALDAFQTLNACALLIAGSHREANRDGSADVAHNPITVFQVIDEVLVTAIGNTSLVLQFHGFASDRHPGYPAVVIGGSGYNSQDPLPLMNGISASLADHNISTGVCEGINWTALCGETNIQATHLPAGLFVHLELNEALRNDPNLLISSLVNVLGGISDH